MRENLLTVEKDIYLYNFVIGVKVIQLFYVLVSVSLITKTRTFFWADIFFPFLSLVSVLK